jgi:DNA-cytosine methyltransferase
MQLLGILNSALADWFFRVNNSNNHVGNYELDRLPFPRNNSFGPLIASLAYIISTASGTGRALARQRALLEAAVFMAYEVCSESDVEIVLNGVHVENRALVMNYVRHLSSGVIIPRLDFGDQFFNNEDPALSELDMRMIRAIPEGGNWQSIPESIPSARLQQIREMTAERGVVRTTYYGRLRRDRPAYTISTYFNRPGNGTHIHPTLDRTLSAREAARLQTFPDGYVFCGGSGAVRNQIGNAVPPLLSHALGLHLSRFAHGDLCVDAFCGAGGLSLGLESAGWHVLAAVDNDGSAIDTYRLNRPTIFSHAIENAELTQVVRSDLTDFSAFRNFCGNVERLLSNRRLDLLVGGPPCQGFSHAGLRLKKDARNDLAAVYLQMTEHLRPDTFVLENVEGLATYRGGAVLRSIIERLKVLGYTVASPVWTLAAEEYGVPQMRRRVFVVATRLRDLSVLIPPSPTHRRCEGRRERSIHLSADISSLQNYSTVAHALSGLSLPHADSDLQDWLAR